MTAPAHHPRGSLRRQRRWLYALLFSRRRCYIGQTTDPRRRWREHAHAWRLAFRPLLLGSVVGTYAAAEDMEHAWRFAAWRAGLRIYADPAAGYFVNPKRQMSAHRYALARACRWPCPWYRRLFRFLVPALALALLALAFAAARPFLPPLPVSVVP